MKERYEEFDEDLEEESIEDVINNYDLNKVKELIEDLREIIEDEEEISR